MSDYEYDAQKRDAKHFEERMALTSFKAKSIEFAVRAELAGTSEVGAHYAQVAQVYATLELARVTASQKRSS
jgi:hypothetical protein